jgi:hypothetical protein
MIRNGGEGRLAQRSVAFAGSTVALEYGGGPAAALVDFLLADVAAGPERGAGGPQWILRLVAPELPGDLAPVQGWEGPPGEGLQALGAQTPEAVLGRLCYQLAWWSDRGLVFHAAAVCRRGRGLLLPGAIGAGKTTLAAWLAAQGCAYMSDELVCVQVGENEGETVCQAFTRPLNLRAGGLAALRAALPGVLPAGGPGEANVLLPPAHFGAVRPQSTAPLGAVIFPDYSPGAALSFVQLAPAAAGLGLMQCLINGRNLPQHGFPAVARLARRVGAWQLTYGSFAQLEAWLAEGLAAALA